MAFLGNLGLQDYAVVMNLKKRASTWVDSPFRLFLEMILCATLTAVMGSTMLLTPEDLALRSDPVIY